MSIQGTTVLTGVAGWPVSHSRSPSIHNYWFALHGIDAAYVPLPVAPKNFREAMRGLQAAGFRGVNVTVPYKEAAAAIADTMEESARHIGAANTLCFTPDGIIHAANTDSSGFMQSLISGAPRWTKDAGPAVVLGAGGAARAVVCALLNAGVDRIRVVNRSVDRALALQMHFGRDLEIFGWAEAPDALEDAALLVNTTTLGMQGHPRLNIAIETLPSNAVVSDLVYAPLETELLAAARRRGLTAIDGMGMLLHQAAAAFALWFGLEPVVDEALRHHVLNRA